MHKTDDQAYELKEKNYFKTCLLKLESDWLAYLCLFILEWCSKMTLSCMGFYWILYNVL